MSAEDPGLAKRLIELGINKLCGGDIALGRLLQVEEERKGLERYVKALKLTYAPFQKVVFTRDVLESMDDYAIQVSDVSSPGERAACLEVTKT